MKTTIARNGIERIIHKNLFKNRNEPAKWNTYILKKSKTGIINMFGIYHGNSQEEAYAAAKKWYQEHPKWYEDFYGKN